MKEEEISGGVKRRAPRVQGVSRTFDFGRKDRSIKKPHKQGFSLTSMQNALKALMNDTKNSSDKSQDTPIRPRSDNSSQSSEDKIQRLDKDPVKKLPRIKKEAVGVPRRPPSQRAAAAAAKKALEKIEDTKKPQPSRTTKKPRAAAPLQKVVKMEIIKEEPTSRSVRVSKHLPPFDDDTIVKRNLSDVIEYPHKEDYANSFTELFEKPLQDILEKVKEHAFNKQEPLQGNQAQELILQLTDDLYFTIRDKLIRKLGLRSRSL
jgi:phosphoribosyl-ATP pyrophosphohydrolase